MRIVDLVLVDNYISNTNTMEICFNYISGVAVSRPLKKTCIINGDLYFFLLNTNFTIQALWLCCNFFSIFLYTALYFILYELNLCYLALVVVQYKEIYLLQLSTG